MLSNTTRDSERFIFVVQRAYGQETATEWDLRATHEEVARALCDSNLPDFPVVRIIECVPSERSSRDVTEDVALLIPAISEEAEREWGRPIRACAVDLMKRYCYPTKRAA